MIYHQKLFSGSFRNFPNQRRVLLRKIISLGRGKVLFGSSFPHFSITRVKSARCNGVFATIMKPVAINSAFKLCQNLPLYLP